MNIPDLVIKQINKKEIRIRIPFQLIKEFMESFSSAFYLRNTWVHSQLVTKDKKGKKIFSPSVEIETVYPKSCQFDLEGSSIESRHLIKEGVLVDFLWNRSYSDNQRETGDVIITDQNTQLSLVCLSTVLKININQSNYEFTAIWKESLIVYNTNDMNVTLYFTLIDKEENFKYFQTYQLNINDFFNSLAQLNKSVQRNDVSLDYVLTV